LIDLQKFSGCFQNIAVSVSTHTRARTNAHIHVCVCVNYFRPWNETGTPTLNRYAFVTNNERSVNSKF